MKRIVFCFTLCIITCSIQLSQAQVKTFTPKQAMMWYKEWSKTHKAINTDNILDIQQLATQYNAHKEWWDTAFAYLQRTDLASLPNGRFQIDGDHVTTVVSEGPSKEYLATKWESHKSYVDIHFLISGGERVAIAPIVSATVTKPFDGTSDTANYTSDGKIYNYIPGSYFIIFPNQVHQPGISDPGNVTYKKIVVKVKVI
jgi:biofilm protein TabA